MRLIDADALLEHLEACLQNGRPISDLYDLSEIVHYVKSMPAASPWHSMEDNGPHWVSVFDDLPRHNAVVVVSDGKRSWDVGQYHFLFKADDRTIWWWKKHTTRKVLWWMYKEDALPEPPKEG